MRIGILYVCTGEYTIFWNRFYESFKEKFCLKSEREFFVFTDADNLTYKENEDVHIIFQEQLGWPYDTLMRFAMFSKIKSDLLKCDYIYFFNANMILEQVINEEEILPNLKQNEELVVVEHPGYMNKKMRYFPLERNPKSKAYIPYNRGYKYVCGGVNGGTAKAYLELIEILKTRIEEDLNNDIIAIVHDESHLNKYILDRNNVRYLTPAFCNPDDLDIDFEIKIRLLDKREFLDINNIKQTSTESIVTKWNRRIKKYARGYFGNIRDSIMKK